MSEETEEAGLAERTAIQKDARPKGTAALAEMKRVPEKVDKGPIVHEEAGIMPIVKLVMTTLFLFFIAWVAALIHVWFVTVLFIVVGALFPIGSWSVGNRYARTAFGHARVPSAEGAPQAQLGGFLADPHDSRRLMLEKPMDEEAARTLETVRADEAGKASVWLDGGATFETVTCESADGCPLSARLLITDPESALWVIVAHGYHGSWSDGMVYARRYAEHGYNLLLSDMRGHGESGGSWIGMGYLDSDDIVAWAQYLVSRFGEDVHILLHGMGMGAAASLMASGETALPHQVFALVADAPYTDAWDALIHYIRGVGMDARPAADLMRLYMKAQSDGYDIASARPLDFVEESPLPILFVTGTRDTLVPPQMTRELWQRLQDKRPDGVQEFVSITGAGHLLEPLSDPDAYWGALFPFIDATLAGKLPPHVGEDEKDSLPTA